MNNLLLVILFVLSFTSISKGQDYSNDDNYYLIILDGEEQYVNRSTGEIVKPHVSKKKQQETIVLNGSTTTKGILSVKLKHTVKRGETLYGIARFYGVNVRELARINQLNLSNTLHVNQLLAIPGKSETNAKINPVVSTHSYTVKKGDTLYSISHKLGITVYELKRINNLETNAIYPGQTLQTR